VAHHSFQGELDHLIDCIRADRVTIVNVKDAVKTHEICSRPSSPPTRAGRWSSRCPANLRCTYVTYARARTSTL